MGLGPLEHIGIAVTEGGSASRLFQLLLGISPYKTEEVAREGVRTIFFQTGETQVELLESLREDSPTGKFLTSRGPGIHHIAFRVSDIRAEMDRLQSAGFSLLSDTPMPGADGKLIVFLHPKTTGGVLVELCQDTPADPA